MMNPELRRNLWLELSLHRLIAMPGVLALVFGLIYALNRDAPGEPLASAAAMLFVAICIVWGTLHAGDAVIAEVRGRTWDGQRMSAVEPWPMTFGKLAGATVFAWYGGILCLLVFLACSPEISAPQIAGMLVAGALLLQALALVGGIAAARKGVVRSGPGGWAVAVLFLVGGPSVAALSGNEEPVLWWGREWARADFMFCTLAVFAAWAVFGAHRLMCQELQVRTLPWAWIAFLLFLAGFVSGFAIRASDAWSQVRNVHFAGALVVSLAAVYPLLLAEVSAPMALRRVLFRLRTGERRRALEEAPLWPLTLALAALFTLLTMLVAGGRRAEGELFAAVQLAPLPLLLLAVRDAAIFMWFSFAAQPRRVEASALLYMVVLYGLVPAILRAMDARALADLVLPPFWDRPGYAVVVAGVHALLAVAAAAWRWKRNYAIRAE